MDSGFSDFETEDANEVLNHYGLTDNQSGWTAIKLLWGDLIEKISKTIGSKSIVCSCEVSPIISGNDFYSLVIKYP